jgi:alkaline phosphatase
MKHAAIVSTFVTVLLAGCSPAPPEGGSAAGNAPARNVILFIGDGMGVSTVTAARIFDGQSRGLRGEEHSLAFDRFPHVALVRTYETNQQTADSAGTATAMMTGHKTRAGVINVGPGPKRQDCDGALQNTLEPLSAKAQRRGLAVGVVTTTRITHATPATVYAHTPERDWESDRYLPDASAALGCTDIATQLISPDAGAGLDLALGGGREMFRGRGGERRDPDEDLPREWLEAAPGRRYVETAAGLDAIEPGEQVLGLFADSHMTYVAERGEDSTEPTLVQMTRAAIRHLSANENGFFLMVESGRIDHGHHDGKPGYAMLETQALSRAVGAALELVDLEETLVLVTADHSHVFSMGGYATRGNPILGLVVKNDSSGEPRAEPERDVDGVPYTTLGYFNGPGAVREIPRPTPETGIDAIYQSAVPVVGGDHDGNADYDETHGGEDVALYGIGAGAENVRGVIEQNRVFDIMMSAYGWHAD